MTTLARATADVTSNVLRVGDLDLFYLDGPGGDPPLLLLHGLSSNAHCFGALFAAGLTPTFRCIAPDLRGRARSGKPDAGYMMADHAKDVLGLLDHLGLDRVVIAGHSFGGYLGIYLAANFPNRVAKLVVIDAAIHNSPRVGELLKPSLSRLGRVVPSAQQYMDELRSAPYLNGVWDEHVEQYFRAELQENPDGTAQSRTSLSAIAQSIGNMGHEPWLHWVQHVQCPVLLLNALEPYGPPDAPPLMEETWARATARAFPNGTYAAVPGNHMTMVFGNAAPEIVREISSFVLGQSGRS